MRTVGILILLYTGFLISCDREGRWQGCMLSAMLGNCLGRVTEFKRDLKTIFSCYPSGVRGPEDFLLADWKVPTVFKEKNIMPYTDDSRMAILVLRNLLGNPPDFDLLTAGLMCSFDMSERMTYLSQQFITDRKDYIFGWAAAHRAPGNACTKGVSYLEDRIRALKTSPVWYHKIAYMDVFTKERFWDVKTDSAGGCGSVMRAYPCGIVFAHDPAMAIEYAVTQSKLTHGAPLAFASCAGIAAGVAAAISGASVDTIITAIINASEQYDAVTTHKIRVAVSEAQKNKKYLQEHGSVLQALQDPAFRVEHERIFTLFPGFAAHDALAGAVYCFCMSPDNVLDALYLGVHTPGDSDSIASLAGALVGAYCGIDQIKHLLPVIEDSALIMSLLHDASAKYVSQLPSPL